MKFLTELALSLLGTPYKWGGNNPMQGLDCSGFVQWLLESVGSDPKGDQTAQTLYDTILVQGGIAIQAPKSGALCFYGPTKTTITHVAFMVSDHQIIEAGGGDHTCINIEESAKKGACVRLRPFGHRKDLVAVVLPNYPLWVTNG